MRLIIIIVAVSLLEPAAANGQKRPDWSMGAGIDLLYFVPLPSFTLSWWVVDQVSLDARAIIWPDEGSIIGGGPTLRLGNERYGFLVSQYVAGEVGGDELSSPVFHFRLGFGARFSHFEGQLTAGVFFWRSCWESDPEDVYIERCTTVAMPTVSLTFLFNVPSESPGEW